MATSNPYAGNADFAEVWEQGYTDGLNGVGGMFGNPPAPLDDESVDKWKEGFKAGKADAKAGMTVAPANLLARDRGAAPDAPAPVTEQAWTFTINGKVLEDVSTAGAQKAIGDVTGALGRRVDLLSGWQEEFHKSCSSSIMNFIIETAGGAHEPDAGVWASLRKEIGAANSAASAGHIPDAAGRVSHTSEAVEAAAKKWTEFLDNFNGGGTAVVHGLEDVVKGCIMIEAVAASAATGGALAGAAIGGTDGAAEELCDQWIGNLEGTQHGYDWTKIGVDGALGLVLGGATGALEPKWAAICAKEAPGLVGANTAMLEKIAPQFIDKATGAVMTPAAMAAALEPLWGKVVTDIPVNVLKELITDAVNAGFDKGTTPESFMKKVLADVEKDTWEQILGEVLKDVCTHS